MGSGRLVTSAFDTTHALGSFGGSTLEAIVETGDVDMEGARYMVTAVRPMATGTSMTVTCSIGTRDSRTSTVTYGSYRGLNRENKVPVRCNNRYVRYLTKVAATADCDHVEGVYLDITPMSNLK